MDITTEPIPADQDAFEVWASRRGVYVLGGGRRGWWDQLSTYIRAATRVLLLDGEPAALLLPEETIRVVMPDDTSIKIGYVPDQAAEDPSGSDAHVETEQPDA